MTIPNELVRDALEASLIVAIADPGRAPKPLQKFLKFQKMPPAAMPVVRKVLDEDDEFRSRVATSVDITKVDAPSRLFLERADGWEGHLAWMANANALATESRTEAKAEQSAQKKLKSAEQAKTKAEARVQELMAELDRVRATVEQERALRRQAETTAHSLSWDIDNLRVRARELEEVAARWQDERAQLQRALAAAQQSPPPPEISPAFDPSGIAASLAEARNALLGLERALDAVDSELPPVSTSGPARAAGERRLRKEKHARRSLSLLPGGVHDDSVEAARYLVSLKHVVLAVDGYNVAMRGWPDLPGLADQRARLLNRLAELYARTRVESWVVFDGTESGDVGASKGQPFRVVFTRAGVTADDEILRLVQTIPRERPVVVASSDREVTEGARRLGANTITADQLLAIL